MNWGLQTSRQIGICWDQTELQRAWFTTHGHTATSYLIFYKLEDSWPSIYYCGIHKYNSLSELLNHFRTKFIRNSRDSGFLPPEFDFEKLHLYEYSKPVYGIDDVAFFTHCTRGTEIKLNK